MPAKEVCGAGKTKESESVGSLYLPVQDQQKGYSFGVATYGRAQESGFCRVGCVFRILNF